MSLYTFFETIFEAVANDASLESWAQTNFGQSVKVYPDLDYAAGPDTDDMPYVVFINPGYESHQERRSREYEITAWIALNKSTYKTRQEENIIEPDGVSLLMGFFELVRDAIKNNLPANTAMGARLGGDTAGMLPEVHGIIAFEFVQHLTIATDPLA